MTALTLQLGLVRSDDGQQLIPLQEFDCPLDAEEVGASAYLQQGDAKVSFFT